MQSTSPEAESCNASAKNSPASWNDRFISHTHTENGLHCNPPSRALQSILAHFERKSLSPRLQIHCIARRSTSFQPGFSFHQPPISFHLGCLASARSLRCDEFFPDRL